MASRWFLILACIAVLSSCDREKKQREATIARGVEIKIEQFRKRQEAICKREAIDKAVVVADSLMRSTGPKTAVKPGVKPPPAIKPVKPAVKQLPDTLRHDALKKN